MALIETPPGQDLTDALVELLKTEDLYAVVVDPEEGFDTGNVLSWLEANVMLGLSDAEYGEGLRASLERILGCENEQVDD